MDRRTQEVAALHLGQLGGGVGGGHVALAAEVWGVAGGRRLAALEQSTARLNNMSYSFLK